MLSSLFEFIEFQPRCGELCMRVITRGKCDIYKLLSRIIVNTYNFVYIFFGKSFW